MPVFDIEGAGARRRSSAEMVRRALVVQLMLAIEMVAERMRAKA